MKLQSPMPPEQPLPTVNEFTFTMIDEGRDWVEGAGSKAWSKEGNPQWCASLYPGLNNGPNYLFAQDTRRPAPVLEFVWLARFWSSRQKPFFQFH